MKSFKIYTAFLIALLAFAACERDMGPTIPADAVAPVFTSALDGNTYLLEKSKEDEQFANLSWSAADFKIVVSPEYKLQIAKAGTNFTPAKTLEASFGFEKMYTVKDFNLALLGSGYEVGTAHELEMRVVSGDYLYSNVIKFTVTPYQAADVWTLIGAAVGGWEVANDKPLIYNEDTDKYELTIDLKPGGYKFRAPSKGKEVWDYNLGLEGDERSIESETGVALIYATGNNLMTSGGNYTFVLDVKNKTCDITQNSSSELLDWTNVVLDIVGVGVSAGNTNATPDPSSWAWGNTLLPDNDGLPTVDGAKFTWVWKGVTLEAASGFKVRTLNGEAPADGGASFNVGFSALNVDNSTDKVTDFEGGFSLSEKGEYTISIMIDSSDDSKVVTITE